MHSREPSNTLQMLFADTSQQSAEDVSGNNIAFDKESNTDDQNDSLDQKKLTILSGKFSLAIRKSWNNEFTEAEKILEKHKDGVPRWSVAYAEIQLVKHLMTGQVSDNETPEITNSLAAAEKLATKVVENRDDFETTLAVFRNDIWKIDIKPNSTSAEDEATFASLRVNYRWDCELALADILLFRSVLQVVGGNEIKGAFNLRKAWKTYCRVRDEIAQVKRDIGKNGIYKNDSANSSRWSLGDALLGRRGSVGSIVGFGGGREGSSVSQDACNSIEVDPDVEDCLEFGLGLFQFVVSIVPGSFLSMLRTFGFNIDREQGIRMLENCYSRGGFRAPFASLFLFVNYLFLTRGLSDPTSSLTRAGVISKECVEKYPNSSPFLFMACQQARKVGNIKEAIDYISTSIKSCEEVGVTSTNHRFEMGMTYLVNLDFSSAKDIFELLFYGNTILFAGKRGSIRLHGSIRESMRPFSKKGSMKKDKSFLQLFEFELRPFCGLCLAGCYLLVKSGEGAIKEALDVLRQTKEMTIPEIENSSIADSIGLLGTSASEFVRLGTGITGGDKKDKKNKTNRYNKFAGRHSAKDVGRNTVSPFILFVILYLRRDIFYMPVELKDRWSEMLETIWAKIEKPTDPDTNAVYLLLRGVFEKFLNPNPDVAQESLYECLTLESGIVNETWVIPHCRYELGELLYKKFGDEEAAMEQFKWILNGSRPISRGGLVPRRDSSISVSSLASRSSIDSNASFYLSNSPDRFKKYEFAKALKTRCSMAAEQIRGGTKSGSASSLLKELHEQTIQSKLYEQRMTLSSTAEIVNNDGNSDSEIQRSRGEQSKVENEITEEDEGVSFSPFKFKKRHKPRSQSLPQNDIVGKESKSNKGNVKALKNKFTGFKFRNCKRRLDQLFIYSNIVTNQVLLTVGRTLKTKYLKSQITDAKQRPHKIRRDFWKPIIAVTGFSSYTSVMTTNNIIQHKIRTCPKPRDYYQLERKARMQDDMNQLEKSVYGLCYAINSLVHTKGYEQEESSKLTIYWERFALKDLPSKDGIKWPMCVRHEKLMLKRGTIMLNKEFKVVQKPEEVREAIRKERYLKSRRGRIEAEKNAKKQEAAKQAPRKENVGDGTDGNGSVVKLDGNGSEGGQQSTV
ncbi:17871_t:CDS:10 [Acaulospora morrowiae]|uniref:17871_t:CDS:1 n=1 Tax=Acaulospora morrowiae TaxID=94023 RepID=A0A9N8YS98_9GLOM|nr:17871_t:CDS:10 [Acaulospora morrowiae]